MNNQNISTQLEELKSILTQQHEKPLCFQEAATYLNVSKSYLYKLTCFNKIPHYKPNGKKIYFAKSDLDNWILRNRVKSKDELESKVTEYIFKKGK